MNTKVLVSISAISSMVNVIPMLAQTPKPNVVIIMTDQQRADFVWSRRFSDGCHSFCRFTGIE